MVIQLVSKRYIENGFTVTDTKNIARELGISTGNINFHYPTKEHLLTEFVKELCDFQWRLIDLLENEDKSPLLALCIEFATMAAAAEDNEAIRDIYISAYTHPISLAVIRENDTRKTQQIFSEFNPDWTDEQFAVIDAAVNSLAPFVTVKFSPRAGVELERQFYSGDPQYPILKVTEAGTRYSTVTATLIQK